MNTKLLASILVCALATPAVSFAAAPSAFDDPARDSALKEGPRVQRKLPREPWQIDNSLLLEAKDVAAGDGDKGRAPAPRPAPRMK